MKNRSVTHNQEVNTPPKTRRGVSFGKRKLLLLLVDVACFVAAYLLNIGFAFMSQSMYRREVHEYVANGAIILCLLLIGRLLFSVYHNVWRYANVKAYTTMVLSDTLMGILVVVLTRYIPCPININIGFSQTFCVVALFDLSTLLSRFCYQLYHQYRNAGEAHSMHMNRIGVAIVGAGQVGSMLADELTYNQSSHYKPVCFIEQDPGKIGAKVCGLRVYAEDEYVIQRIKELPVQEILIALPAITSEKAAELYAFYSRTGCKVKLYDFPLKEAGALENSNARRMLRDVQIQDLLFRDSRVICHEATTAYYQGKVVLVTGGGGSIGSELCRQIAACRPQKLVILDIYENNAYHIQQELLSQYGDEQEICVEIASVRDVARLDHVFATHRPQIVFHAAAHKHVPLMEHNPTEAIKNNVFGTYNTANMAEKYGAEKFILISTDKAVNPTGIMGASKRMCEFVVGCRGGSPTTYSAVRFGNVLGSNGSVIPLFQEQIQKGGPVTVTDKRIIRYFMTIPEASQLLMETGVMASGGDLFVLDMGKPVRILDLAENMIRLSGYEPYHDIDIVEIGLRPGEKLYEELLMQTETLTKTQNSLIFVEHEIPPTRQDVEGWIDDLRKAVWEAEHTHDMTPLQVLMKTIVPTYKDPDEANLQFEDSPEKKASEADDAHT